MVEIATYLLMAANFLHLRETGFSLSSSKVKAWLIFCKLLASSVDKVKDLELIVGGTDGQNFCWVHAGSLSGRVGGFRDGFVVVKFTLTFLLPSLPVLESLCSGLLDCPGDGIVDPCLHLQFVTDQVGDDTIILTKELKVDDV